MKKEYLSEAFRQLELLNEEDFNLSTTADNSDLKDFLDNDDMSVMSLDVIDPEAETEEDLEDSYTGKVILDCCVCHSKLYKDKEEVQIDEEQDLANTDEECPFCYSHDGFKIIGEVAPYGESEEETEIEDEEHEGFDESLNTRKNRKLKESRVLKEQLIIPEPFNKYFEISTEEPTKDDYQIGDKIQGYNDTLLAYLDPIDDSLNIYPILTDNPSFPVVELVGGRLYPVDVTNFMTDDEDDEDFEESLKTRRNKSVNESEEGKKLFTEYKILVDGRTYEISHTKQRADEIVPILKDMYPDSEIEAKPYKHYASGIERKRLEKQIADQLKEYGVNESVNENNHKPAFENMSMKDLYYYYRDNIDQDEYPTFLHWAETIVTPTNSENNEIEESLYESIENAIIDTENETITMTSKEDGGVSVETSPKECCEDDEVLVPLEPETEQQIENNSSDEIDVPIDEFDEETFDELGESFLKNTYENVKGYKTESIKEQDGNKLVIEGLITFNSGKVKKTSFIFEAKDITKSGKVRFIGENCQLSRGKKSFTVAGKIQEGKFISESLNYNYRAKDAKSGKSTRMYGTVRTNK